MTRAAKKPITTKVSKNNRYWEKQREKEIYGYVLFGVLREVHPNVQISCRAMSTMNSMMNDIFDRLAEEAKHLMQCDGRSTLQTRDIETAVRLVFRGELAQHAIIEGKKAIIKYEASRK